MSDSEIPVGTGTPAANPSAAPSALATGGGTIPGMLNLGPSWQEQDGTLRDLWMQNKTPQEISDVLGRSVAAIMTRAARLGLPRRSAPGRKPGSSRRMLTDGQEHTTNAVPRTGVPRQTVARTSDNTQQAPQSSPRVCLMCLRSFQSLGRHNRICPSCKSSSEYESATSMADIHFPV